MNKNETVTESNSINPDLLDTCLEALDKVLLTEPDGEWRKALVTARHELLVEQGRQDNCDYTAG